MRYLLILMAIAVIIGCSLGCSCRKDNREKSRELVRELEDGKDRPMSQVRDELVSLGQDAVPELRLGLKNKCPYVRQFCIEALGSIVPVSEDVVPDLIVAIADEEPFVAAAAVRSLGKIGEPAVAPLSQVVHDQRPDVVRRAVVALGEIGRNVDSALPVVRSMTNHKDWRVRESCLLALAKLPATNDSDADRFLGGIHDENNYVKMAAAGGLAMHGQLALGGSILVKFLVSEDARERARAAMLLGELPRHDRGTTRGLICAASDPFWQVRLQVIIAVGRMEPKPDEVVHALGQALADDEWEIRVAAAEAIEKLGPRAHMLRDQILSAAQDGGPTTEEICKRILAKMEGNSIR